MTGHRLFPYFLIVTAGVIWGATFSLALIATAQGAHPLGLSAWQVVLTAAFFLVFSFFHASPCSISGICVTTWYWHWSA
jgi:hypothetical protein